MRRQQGFTLVELLVALLVFAMLAAAGVVALRLTVDARDQLGAADTRIRELQLARLSIKEDMAQIALRRTRDAFGEPAGPAFLGGVETQRRAPVSGERLLLAFVRRGWVNPEHAAPRSSLQYVEYVEKESALIRRIRPFVDDARGQPVFERVLASDVADVGIRFLVSASGEDLVWSDGWPAFGGGGAPQAIEIVFSTPRFTGLRQLFWIGDVTEGGGE